MQSLTANSSPWTSINNADGTCLLLMLHVSLGTTWKSCSLLAPVLQMVLQSLTCGLEIKVVVFFPPWMGVTKSVNLLQRKWSKDIAMESSGEQRQLCNPNPLHLEICFTLGTERSYLGITQFQNKCVLDVFSSRIFLAICKNRPRK